MDAGARRSGGCVVAGGRGLVCNDGHTNHPRGVFAFASPKLRVRVQLLPRRRSGLPASVLCACRSCPARGAHQAHIPRPPKMEGTEVLTVNLRGIRELDGYLQRLGADLPKAQADGINRTARAIEQAELNEFESRLDNPTPFTMNAIFRLPASASRQQLSIGIKDLQAKYLRYPIEGGVVPKTILPINIRRNRYGNIPGKRGGLQQIAGTRGRRFVAEINGTYGVWERYGRGGSRVRLLAMAAKNQRRDKRLDWFGVAERVAEGRLRRDLIEAIRGAG